MRLYLAGLEGVTTYNNFREYIYSIKDNFYWLTSFYYARNRTQIQDLLNICNKENVLLDSGAFTFRMHGLKNTDIDTYTQEYIDFINKYDIKYFFEMDIDFDAESYKKVLELRKKIERGTGKQCIPVWHDTRGIEEFKKHCEEYDYVAIGGLVGGNVNKIKKILISLIKYANSKNVKIHLLGYNKVDILDYKVFSCDATSWNASRYGGLWTWDNKTQRPKKRNRSLERRIESSRQKEVFLHNLKVWIHYQRVLKHKGYWREQ